MSGRRDADSSPRQTPGFSVLLFVVRFGVCRRLMVIGRVSPRRASDFLVATRKSPKKRPLPHRRLRRFPRFGRVRRVASKLALRAQTATRQFPPATASARRRRRGRGRRLGFAFAGGALWDLCDEISVCLCVWSLIRRPGEGRGPGFCLLSSRRLLVSRSSRSSYPLRCVTKRDLTPASRGQAGPAIRQGVLLSAT